MKPIKLIPTAFTLAAIFSFLTPIEANSDTVSLSTYLNWAVANHPQAALSQADVDAANAGRKSTNSRYLPHLQLQAGESHQEPLGNTSSSRTSSATTATTANLSLQQLVFDFGKTPAQMNAASKTLDAAKSDQAGIKQDIILNAKSAYFSCLLSMEVLKANQEAVKQADAHLELARRTFETGKQPKYAVTKAEVDAANARVNLLQKTNNLALSRIQLANAAGLDANRMLELSDSLPVSEPELNLDSLSSWALEKRPDMLSVKAKEDAAEAQWLAARRALYPNLNATGSLGWKKPSDSDGSQDWSVGVNLSAPLFQGGALLAATEQAKAGWQKARKSTELQKQTVLLEIRQRFLEKKAAQEQIIATGKLLEQAKEGLSLSQARYNAGLAASIEIMDAEQTLLSASTSSAQAWFDYRLAHARLMRATGILDN